MEICVTGFGIISPLGIGYAENIAKLESNTTGITKAMYLDSIYAEKFIFGEVKETNLNLGNKLNLEIDTLSRTDILALIACNEAIEMAELTKDEINSFDTALISSSTVGGMSQTDDLYNDANLLSQGSNFLFSYGSGVHTLRLAKHFSILGITDTINTACSSSANAIMIGARLIKAKKAKRVIVGGVDSLSKFTVNGFNSLQIISTELCRPFCENRMGLNLGEGAAYLVLESSEAIKNKKVYAKISGYGNHNDGFHPTALSDNAIGPMLAMEGALYNSQIDKKNIDLINSHGTATLNNDLTELTGIKKIFNENIPPIYSTKSYTGHTLAASGAMEAIFSIFSILNGSLYKSLNCEDPIDNCPIIQKNQSNIEVNHVLSNSFGFGGNCTTLIISKFI